jgi:hypothetical protein
MSRRLSVAALLVAALVWGAASPALAAERSSRPRVGANGVHTVRLVERGAGNCMLEVATDSGVAWKLEQCVGGVDDLYFVSNDGKRVWMIKPLVEKGQGKPPRKASKKAPPPWAKVAVGALYGPEGRVKEVFLLDFVPLRELGEVRQLSKYFKWLEGTLDVPGKTPRLTEDQHVEFESVAKKTHRLSFY